MQNWLRPASGIKSNVLVTGTADTRSPLGLILKTVVQPSSPGGGGSAICIKAGCVNGEATWLLVLVSARLVTNVSRPGKSIKTGATQVQ
jgi:hypothetical protein